MSIVAPSQRRLVVPISLALTLACALGLLLYLPNRPAPVTEAPGSVAAPGVPQAPWRIKVFPAGGLGVPVLSNKTKTRVRAQQARLAAVVESVYDALFLEPARLSAAVKETFAKDAGDMLLARKAGLPKSATEVQIKKRIAQVGVSVLGATQAAARVEVSGKAMADGRKIKFKHESTLWLERSHHEWKVIAFDLRQGPRR